MYLKGWTVQTFLYVFLISSGVAVLGNPKVKYNESPDVLKNDK